MSQMADLTLRSESAASGTHERPADPCAFVIFGASGDLTKRLLMPAIYNLACDGLLPQNFAIVGTAKTDLNHESFREQMSKDIRQFTTRDFDNKVWDEFVKNLYYVSGSFDDPSMYERLKQLLNKVDTKHNTDGNYLFYLAVPPVVFGLISRQLGIAGFANEGMCRPKLVVEKTFGQQLERALNLNRELQEYWQEHQIWRIDHYLGKETVQNVLAFRFANGIFEPLWNRNYVNHIEVTASEHIGVEDRGEYYDNYGALRDMVQNHLLQIVGIIAMEPPSFFDATAVRNETVKVFQSLRPIKPEEVGKYAVRGQYTKSTIRGEKVPGYRNEQRVAPDSRTETFAALKLYIDNWRWGDLPFYIRTGKRLPTRETEVVIHFKKTPHHLFTQNNICDVSCNELIIRIQPDEGILLKFGMKMPGAGFQIKDVNMNFHYSDLGDAYIPEAYERLLLDCILGDATLYARTDAVEACWRYVDPILLAWGGRPDIKIYGYPVGTWGPKEAHELFDNP